MNAKIKSIPYQSPYIVPSLNKLSAISINYFYPILLIINTIKYFGLPSQWCHSNMISTYNTPQAEQLSLVKNWLGRKSMQFIELLTHAEKDRYNTLEGLFKILTRKLKPKFNETIKSLQFHKLSRQNRKNAEEWMGRLQVSVIECNYKGCDRLLKEQFIHGLGDTDIMRNNQEAHKHTWKYRNN